MEKDNTTAFEVAEAHKALKRNLTERKASNFVTMRDARGSPGPKGCSFSARRDFVARYTPSCAITMDSPTSALAACDRDKISQSIVSPCRRCLLC
ncbi:hypothetical protein AVEN_114523-1 [Araneus ventricosus]|uniref:Uncharacterized protein n=1 Tax=Araneus ventricosus TaxID=182803 RepID=A0A4Y2FU50_ARAVE|nr:hypothetical protein AVEN_114523-1 [Araneus ventricosus]